MSRYLCLLCLLTFTQLAIPAPAPLARRVRDDAVPTWHGVFGNAAVRFLPGGVYEETWFGARYAGTWRRTAEGIVVHCRLQEFDRPTNERVLLFRPEGDCLILQLWGQPRCFRR